jgi:glycosyltransferase involved in cell wall biosynthesis
VEAARRVLEARPEARFVLVGAGDRRASLEEQVRRLGLGGRFVLPGFLEDVAPALEAIDLFALPSVSGEGSPAVIKEAMACGVPVVASRLDGVREIVRDGREALLVEPAQPDALARALLRLADDETLREQIRDRAFERVMEFSVDRTVERTLEVYRRALARRERRAG